MEGRNPTIGISTSTANVPMPVAQRLVSAMASKFLDRLDFGCDSFYPDMKFIEIIASAAGTKMRRHENVIAEMYRSILN